MTNESTNELPFDPEADLYGLTHDQLLAWAIVAQRMLVVVDLTEDVPQSGPDTQQPPTLPTPDVPLSPQKESSETILDKITLFRLIGFQKYVLEASRVDSSLSAKADLSSSGRPHELLNASTSWIDDSIYLDALSAIVSKRFPDSGISGIGSINKIFIWHSRASIGGYVVGLYGVLNDLDRIGDRRPVFSAGLEVVFSDKEASERFFNQLTQAPDQTINSLADQVWHLIEGDTRFYRVGLFPGTRVFSKDLVRKSS